MSLLSDAHRQKLAAFIGESVLPATRRTYERHWDQWIEFLSEDSQVRDPLLRGVKAEDKAALLGLFLHRRYKAGFRDKGATAVTAGLRMHFAQSLESIDFLDAAVITTARHARKTNPTELRTLEQQTR